MLSAERALVLQSWYGGAPDLASGTFFLCSLKLKFLLPSHLTSPCQALLMPVESGSAISAFHYLKEFKSLFYYAIVG